MNLALPWKTRGVTPTASPRLRAGLAALLTVMLAVMGVEVYAGTRLRREVVKLASLNLPEATRSPVLQRALFARAHCLLVYGSSEMSIAQSTRPDLFFHRQAHGFDVRLIGQTGDRCLPMLQELAALGPVARGKKAVVFLSPVWFLPSPESEKWDHSAHRQFAATFSESQVGETVLNDALKPALKRRIAARLLDYDNVIRERAPLVSTALRNLAGTAPVQQGFFLGLVPLVRLRDACLSWQECYHWLEVSRERRGELQTATGSAYQARHEWTGWAQFAADIDREEGETQAATFYSLGPGAGAATSRGPSQPGRPPVLADRDSDAGFLRRMQAASEWDNLELLLQTARSVGLHLLLIDQPINGLLSNAQGVTPRARQAYYQRVAQVAAAHGVPLRDFSAYEEDLRFFLDEVHPSAKAWVLYDQALEEFYRGNDK